MPNHRSLALFASLSAWWSSTPFARAESRKDMREGSVFVAIGLALGCIGADGLRAGAEIAARPLPAAAIDMAARRVASAAADMALWVLLPTALMWIVVGAAKIRRANASLRSASSQSPSGVGEPLLGAAAGPAPRGKGKGKGKGSRSKAAKAARVV